MLRGATFAFILRAAKWTPSIYHLDQFGFWRFLVRRGMQRVQGASVDHL